MVAKLAKVLYSCQNVWSFIFAAVFYVRGKCVVQKQKQIGITVKF